MELIRYSVGKLCGFTALEGRSFFCFLKIILKYFMCNIWLLFSPLLKTWAVNTVTTICSI